MQLCLHKVGFNIPADDIAFALLRGIATDNPPGLADVECLKLCIDALSEWSVVALQRVLRMTSTVLSKLNLRNEWIDDGTVEKICHSLTCNATHTKLLLLNLTGNKIGNAGVKSLARMLKSNTMLQELHLSMNEIGDQGVVALATALAKHNRTLRLVDLEKNQIGDKGVMAMARALQVNSSLEQLFIQRNPPVTHVGEQFLVESVAKIRGLLSLEFGPVRKMANFKRLATAMESNHSIVHIRYVIWEDTFLEPEDLDEFPPHMRPHWTSILYYRATTGQDYANIDIPKIRIEMLAKYVPYVIFLCRMNEELRPLLTLPEDRAPVGLWPHVMVKAKGAAEIFCLLRERPDLAVGGMAMEEH